MMPPWMEQPINPPQPQATGVSRPCDYCDVEIREGDGCVELFDGILGKSPKSGQGIVVDTAPGGNVSLIVHKECLLQSLIESEPELDPFRFCAGCGVNLTDSDDD